MSKKKLAEEVKLPEEAKPSEANALLEAYKKQNPVKYEAKKKAGEFKGLIAIIAVCLLVSVGVVQASNGNLWDKIAQVAGEVLGNRLVGLLPTEELSLGAVPSADQLPSLVCSNDLCTYTVVTSFVDASNTIASIPDPFLTASSSANYAQPTLRDDGNNNTWKGATTTVDLVRIYITGVATSAVRIACGSATSYNTYPSVEIVSTTYAAPVPTSTGGVIENNVTSAQGGLTTGGSTAKIMMGSDYPYFNCYASGLVNDTAITNPLNTFAGKVVVRFNRLRY